jgi:sulfur-carrier protein
MKVIVPIQLQRDTYEPEVEASGTNIGEALNDLISRFPSLERKLFANGELNKFVNVYVNDEDIRFLDGLKTSLKSSDVITLIPAIAGG